MGLDNGILIRTKQKLSIDSLPSFVNIEIDEYAIEDRGGGYWYEVCYWRKCWNVRDVILDMHLDYDKETDVYILSKEHIHELRLALIKYVTNMYKWEEEYENGRTIWDSRNMLYHLAGDIANLTWLENYMNNHRVHVEFYDSY